MWRLTQTRGDEMKIIGTTDNYNEPQAAPIKNLNLIGVELLSAEIYVWLDPFHLARQEDPADWNSFKVEIHIGDRPYVEIEMADTIEPSELPQFAIESSLLSFSGINSAINVVINETASLTIEYQKFDDDTEAVSFQLEIDRWQSEKNVDAKLLRKVMKF
jgi:hypothetical protein